VKFQLIARKYRLLTVFHLGKNYSIDRDGRRRYRHSYVFMRGATVAIKLLNYDELLKGKISTIEEVIRIK